MKNINDDPLIKELRDQGDMNIAFREHYMSSLELVIAALTCGYQDMARDAASGALTEEDRLLCQDLAQFAEKTNKLLIASVGGVLKRLETLRNPVLQTDEFRQASDLQLVLHSLNLTNHLVSVLLPDLEGEFSTRIAALADDITLKATGQRMVQGAFIRNDKETPS